MTDDGLAGFTPPRSPGGLSAMLPAPPWPVQVTGWVAHWSETPASIEPWVRPPCAPTGRVLVASWRWALDRGEEPPRPATSEAMEVALGFEVEVPGQTAGARETGPPMASLATWWAASWCDRDWLLALRWLCGTGAKLGDLVTPARFVSDAGLVTVERHAQPVLRFGTSGDNPDPADLPGLKRAVARRHLPDPLLASAGAPLVDELVEEVRSAVRLGQAGSRLGVVTLFDGDNEAFGPLAGRALPVRVEQVRLTYRLEHLRPLG